MNEIINTNSNLILISIRKIQMNPSIKLNKKNQKREYLNQERIYIFISILEKKEINRQSKKKK